MIDIPHRPIRSRFTATAAEAKPACREARCGPSLAPSDGELLVRYAESGSPDAFADLVHRHERKMFHYLHRRLSDAQLAEDALQATFLQVHLKCRDFDPGRTFQPWLYKIATNQAIDLLRRNRRHKAASLDAPTPTSGRREETPSMRELLTDRDRMPGERIEATEDRQMVRGFVEKLPRRLKQALTLVIYQGYSYRKAADVLGIPLGTVKSRVNAARQRLRAALAPVAESFFGPEYRAVPIAVPRPPIRPR